jgi:pimeloyl-ACP methyl ester carboxylesterase
METDDMHDLDLDRRSLLLGASMTGLALAGGVAGCAHAGSAAALPPIVFVHGNGDTAALWLTTLWRFESNGWPRERLHALHLPYPLARDVDDRPQPGRTSTAEHRAYLAAEVDRLLAATGAAQVVLLANSRGGNAVRSYVMQGGAAKVSHAILGGTPNHGVRFDAASNPGNEFNGAGPFLQGLNNQGGPGVEVTAGPRWMTIRSDNNDKFAQPEGTWIGAPGKATGVNFDGPELKGALNVVLPGIDHRETSFSPQAFAAAYRFITGREPATTGFAAEDRVVLDGQVSGQGLDNNPATGAFASNLPLAGATVEVYATDAQTGARVGDARWRKTTGADGRWGPFQADGRTSYEFVISAPGYAVVHIYRQPFPRSSAIVNFRAERLLAADAGAGSVLTFTRPRGYFGLPRDEVVFDGQNPAPGIPRGVAGLAASKIKLPAGPQRPVVARFNGQTMVGRNWPAAENHVVLIELH